MVNNPAFTWRVQEKLNREQVGQKNHSTGFLGNGPGAGPSEQDNELPQ